MKRITTLLVLLTLATIARAQTDIDRNANKAVANTSQDTVNINEREPSFPGGVAELSKFLKDNVKYNGSDKGRVIVSFVIEKDGSLSNITVVKSLSPSADQAVLNAMRKMPKWLPGVMNRHLLRVSYVLPVSF